MCDVGRFRAGISWMIMRPLELIVVVARD